MIKMLISSLLLASFLAACQPVGPIIPVPEGGGTGPTATETSVPPTPTATQTPTPEATATPEPTATLEVKREFSANTNPEKWYDTVIAEKDLPAYLDYLIALDAKEPSPFDPSKVHLQPMSLGTDGFNANDQELRFPYTLNANENFTQPGTSPVERKYWFGVKHTITNKNSFWYGTTATYIFNTNRFDTQDPDPAFKPYILGAALYSIDHNLTPQGDLVPVSGADAIMIQYPSVGISPDDPLFASKIVSWILRGSTYTPFILRQKELGDFVDSFSVFNPALLKPDVQNQIDEILSRNPKSPNEILKQYHDFVKLFGGTVLEFTGTGDAFVH